MSRAKRIVFKCLLCNKRRPSTELYPWTPPKGRRPGYCDGCQDKLIAKGPRAT